MSRLPAKAGSENSKTVEARPANSSRTNPDPSRQTVTLSVQELRSNHDFSLAGRVKPASRSIDDGELQPALQDQPRTGSRTCFGSRYAVS